MNTVERIVESYFRLCRGCLTYPDLKVLGGNNRQLDLLACNLREDAQYHIEMSVTHELSWRATWEKLQEAFKGKYFGAPRAREGQNTDFARGKSYGAEIQRAYRSIGFTPRKVQRIWVTWVVPQEPEFDGCLLRFCKQKRLGKYPIKVLSFRDEVLPQLLSAVGKSNYNDDVLRTLSLLRQYERQTQPLNPLNAVRR
jgi:hypothetical protein